MPNTDNILRITGLTVDFFTKEGTVRAVDHISFDLPRGKVLGIVGESGLGKTVSALTVMRLHRESNIQVTGDGIYFSEKENEAPVNLLGLGEKQMENIRGEKIAMIFQEPMTSLNPVHRCGDQVAEAILVHKKVSRQAAKARTLALFDKVRLEDPLRIWNSYPHQLSGGQKQRVMIAMALSCEPALLIADEPTTALDVTVQASILGLLKDLQQEFQLSILFITHDLGLIGEFADMVIVMHKGKIVESGDIQKVFSKPTHPYTKGLIACRPPLAFKLRRLLTISDFLKPESAENEQVEDQNIPDLLAGLIITPQQEDERLEQLQQQKPLLKVRNLRAWFPVRRGLFLPPVKWVKAVDDVSFDVYPGEILGLVGESGCGKTTLGRTLLRLVKATGGQVHFRGNDILEMGAGDWRRFCPQMQIVFQDPYASLNPRMTAGAAIMEPMLLHRLYPSGEAKAKTLELLQMVGLDESHFYRYPREFSGGQRQRICIARALALKPEFIICDESVSALDVSIQAQVLNLLLDLRERIGFTCIFISHDLSVVKCISDRIIVMNNGKIEEIGPARQIYENPVSPYTKKLIEAIPKAMDN